MINYLLWIVLGAVAGYIASIVMKSNASQGLIMDIVIGILGSFLGGFLYTRIFSTSLEAFSLMGLLVAVVGAAILIYVLRLVTGKR